MSLWPAYNDFQCFHHHHYHPARNITPDWSFYILWCIGINGKFDPCSVFFSLGLFSFKLLSLGETHWWKVCVEMYFLPKVCLTQKYILGLSFFKKSFEPAALVYSYLWDKLATKGEIRSGSAVYHIYIYSAMIIRWLCMISIYTEVNRYSVMVYHIHLRLQENWFCLC